MSIIIFLILIILVIEVSYLVYKTDVRVGRSSKEKLFIDTSALMDGRIVTAAQTGFIPSSLVVPRSVINELQLLADQADAERRSRARRGLDAVSELQEMKYLNVDVIDDGPLGAGGVDERLIDLARAQKGSICTIDFNLNKAATALGVRVLNINELAGGIRMAFLPGETISLTLSQKGQSNTQAVGYLADGTMVVVDKASAKLGETVEIEFIRSLQTAAGRMMFAKLAKQPEQATVKPNGRRKTQAFEKAEQQPVQSTSAERVEKSKPSDSRRKPTSFAALDKSESKDVTVVKPKPTQSRRRRKSGEDSLIELINQ
ncbi:MAG: TRAM domain-containing protein [Patescibacteria group bacterium]